MWHVIITTNYSCYVNPPCVASAFTFCATTSNRIVGVMHFSTITGQEVCYTSEPGFTGVNAIRWKFSVYCSNFFARHSLSSSLHRLVPGGMKFKEFDANRELLAQKWRSRNSLKLWNLKIFHFKLNSNGYDCNRIWWKSAHFDCGGMESCRKECFKWSG